MVELMIAVQLLYRTIIGGRLPAVSPTDRVDSFGHRVPTVNLTRQIRSVKIRFGFIPIVYVRYFN